jgi:site-specific DNA-methyltransferase (adenine-specific)
MNILKEENNIKIDAIITSPPYNINKSYSEYNDKRERNEYMSWLQKIAKKSLEILKEDGSFFLNVGSRPTDFMLPFEIYKNFVEAGYKLQNKFIG